MKQFKKNPRLQLEKFSTIFTQLGLVLVLFIVFISLEHETEQTAVVIEKRDKDGSDTYVFDTPPVFIKEVIKKPEERVERRKATIINEPKVVDNDTPDDTVFVPTVEDVPPTDVIINEVPEEEEIHGAEDPTPVAMNFVTKIPVFAGCENLSEIEGRKCFDKKMSKLINRHFNSGLGEELGLRSGKHRITTQFVIDKSGKVTDVNIRAPHNSLKKEVKRVVSKIPSFTPGENNGKPVNVRYTLPISFKVE